MDIQVYSQSQNDEIVRLYRFTQLEEMAASDSSVLYLSYVISAL